LNVNKVTEIGCFGVVSMKQSRGLVYSEKRIRVILIKILTLNILFLYLIIGFNNIRSFLLYKIMLQIIREEKLRLRF
jgi:hypothetical protein